MAALNGEPLACVSLVGSTASTSTRPTREKPATSPGATHLPVASTIVASAGTATPAPAAAMRPSRMTTVPPSTGAEPSPKATRSEEHTSELQSLMHLSYAFFFLKNKKNKNP